MKQLAIIFSIVFLSGCVQTQTRDCISFDHPIYSELSGTNEGGNVYFNSEDGRTLSLSTSYTWVKKRRTVKGRKEPGNANLVCHEYLLSTFQIQESSTWLRYQLSHWDLPEIDFDDEALKTEFFVGRIGNSAVVRNFSYTFNPSDQSDAALAKLGDQPEQTIEKLTSVSIGGKAIADVVKVTLTSPNENGDPDALPMLRTIYLSKQYGLVRLVLDSGRIYDRNWSSS